MTISYSYLLLFIYYFLSLSFRYLLQGLDIRLSLVRFLRRIALFLKFRTVLYFLRANYKHMQQFDFYDSLYLSKSFNLQRLVIRVEWCVCVQFGLIYYPPLPWFTYLQGLPVHMFIVQFLVQFRKKKRIAKSTGRDSSHILDYPLNCIFLTLIILRFGMISYTLVIYTLG